MIDIDLISHYDTARRDARGIHPAELEEAAFEAVDLAESQQTTVWDVLRASGLRPDERATLARAWDQLGPGSEHEEFLR